MSANEQPKPTPETDAETLDGAFKEQGCTITLRQWDYYKDPYGEVVMADFARKLERERDEAIKALETDFMQGAYARLKYLQECEFKVAALEAQAQTMREAIKEARVALAYYASCLEQQVPIDMIGGVTADNVLTKLKPFLP